MEMQLYRYLAAGQITTMKASPPGFGAPGTVTLLATSFTVGADLDVAQQAALPRRLFAKNVSQF
jgi:hypothetical protein